MKQIPGTPLFDRSLYMFSDGAWRSRARMVVDVGRRPSQQRTATTGLPTPASASQQQPVAIAPLVRPDAAAAQATEQ